MKLEELVYYCVKYAESIYVRAEVNGKWGAYNLKQIPPSEAADHILRWYNDGKIPVRVLTEEEINAKPETES